MASNVNDNVLPLLFSGQCQPVWHSVSPLRLFVQMEARPGAFGFLTSIKED